MLEKNLSKRNTKTDDGILCIDTYRIFDSCKIKECAQNLRLYLTPKSMTTVNNSVSLRIKSVKTIWTGLNSDKVPFSSGYFQVNIRYYFLVTLECCVGAGEVEEVIGLSIFDKSVVLYGGEGEVDSFRKSVYGSFCQGMSDVEHFKKAPRTVIDCANPIPLKIKVVLSKSPSLEEEVKLEGLPDAVAAYFTEGFENADSARRVYVSLGVFSIVRMERPCEIVVPACDFCIPRDESKEAFPENDACALFKDMDFPIGEFVSGVSLENKNQTPVPEPVIMPND